MSGYNGYPVVFGANKTWETYNAVDYIYDINSTIVHITNVKHAANGLLYSYVKRDGALANIKEIPAFRVTVKGLGRGGRGRGMMNRIGYRTYDNYEGDEHRSYDEHHRGYDDDERMLLMRMLGVGEDERYEYGDEHFNKQEAKQTVDEMYHVKDGKKYIGEKYDMQKAHEVCNKFKDKLEEDIEVADVYVAINAQYHDYCKLFEKWFGKGNFDDMIFESAIDFWFDDVDFGEDKLWKYFNELK